ncbi:D-proline reductase proprotein PrdA (plasmid) [Peptoclostridium acidaminophilum DSM 3953]|uniref:D-proline reductase proprotein PrdA n=1 Tax=Peptoclostridium acidaminophilum DSM 3953 TaxID=1286171 RepID=W8TJ02_PEPAC|nr:D-proline reductase proprotein PrdA [Peptoclostridium acidaminophilum DSM 3953]
MANTKKSSALVRRNYKISKVEFAEKTKIEGNILYIERGICAEALGNANKDIVLDMSISIINAGEYGCYTDTILDVQPFAVKEKGSVLGEGATRSLSGVAMMLCGKDDDGEQISEAGSSEGILSSSVRFNRPGSIDNGEIIIKIDCLIKSGERMKRSGPLACHKAAEYISEHIRSAVLALGDEDFTAGCADEQEFTYARHEGRPKVLLVKEIMGQGAMHEKLLLPLQPCGITGSRSNIDMGNIPLVLSPLEAIDGGVHALTCVGPSTKETSRHYFRDPLVMQALSDSDIDMCGVAFVGSPAVSQQKYMIAERLGMLAEAMDADGVIIATEGYGNNHIDFAAYLEAIGKRGIPAAGATFCGNFGPLITGNKFTCHLVDCAKSATGLENSILADNTMVEEDAEIVIAMLKAVISGKRVSAPPQRWDTAVRRKNISKMKEGGQGIFQSEIPTATMPSIVWTPVTKPLSEMKIALVTGTGVHLRDDKRFNLSCDSSFRIIPGDALTARLTVSHGGYDNTDALADINSMFPLDRLSELAEEGLIAAVAPRHIGFMGGGGDLKALANETGPAIADILKKDGVDAAVFTAG